MMEMRITLALTIRKFSFSVEYPTDAPEVLGDQAYNVMYSSAGPAGGMPVKISNIV